MSELMSIEGGLPAARSDSAETLERLLDSARTIIARDGIEGLSIPAIAAAAGITTDSAHVYFGSRAQVVSEVLWRQLIASSRTASRGAGSGAIKELRAEAVDTLRLRARTAGRVQRRIRAALGRGTDAATTAHPEAIYTSALFDAATGYAALSNRLRTPEKLVDRILDRR
ncbi:TetR family transcriptional regulator [Nocardia tengchongensis]|uniref:TetR family transcriptional regulator n=1 Tax=Nocardia tengchongensis TaxID=2055889 RepID=UPI00367C8E29